MLIKDELLRNSKKLWANVLLCFNFVRNIKIMMFYYGINSDKLRHKNAMYFVLFVGFLWFI